MGEENLSLPTTAIDRNIDQSDMKVDSVFGLEIDFDPENACTRLLERDVQSEKYLMKGKIAQGGMGAIYEALDRDLKRTTVLKVMLPEIMQNRQMFISFIDEARITGQLEHPNIIPVHDLGVLEDKKLFFSMKRIEGVGLNTILSRVRDGEEESSAKYTIYSLLTLFRKVCDAVAYAHSRDFIHRDIKPENIMVGDYGEVLLVDWGLARHLGEPESTPDSVDESEGDPLSETVSGRTETQHGLIKGTPAFMSPEQAKGSSGEIDKRSDIFLLGSTLYSIATLTLPYQGSDIYEIIENAEEGNIQPPHERAPQREFPIELSRIIMKAMAFERDDRYQSVEDMIEDIDDLMEGRTVSEQKVFKAGELMLNEGDQGREAYVIISGVVDVFKTTDGNEISLIQLKDGDTIGEMSMISEAPRSASVRAVTNTHVVVITEDIIKRGLDKLPPWMGNVVQALVERLRTTNMNVHPLFSTDCTYHVLNQLRMIYICWGLPEQDEYSENIIVTLNIEKTIKEISTNISISIDRVTSVISKLLDSGIVDAVDYDRLGIPNLEIFDEFLNFIVQRESQAITYSPLKDITLRTSPDQLTIRRMLPEGKSNLTNPDLVLIRSKGVEELLGCYSEEEVTTTFEEIYGALHENGNN